MNKEKCKIRFSVIMKKMDMFAVKKHSGRWIGGWHEYTKEDNADLIKRVCTNVGRKSINSRNNCITGTTKPSPEH